MTPSDPVSSQSPNLLDALWRFAYRAAFLAARLWWCLRRPRSVGALIALWDDNCVLLVRTSYRGVASLPGGFVRRGESLEAAAVRELAEETGVTIEPAALSRSWAQVLPYECRQDAVTIFDVWVSARPRVTIDHREIVHFEWADRRDALRQRLLPHVRAYLEDAKPTA